MERSRWTDERLDDAFEGIKDLIAHLEERMDKRFDTVDDDHATVMQKTDQQTKWLKVVSAVATVLAALGAFATPIVVAILTTG